MEALRELWKELVVQAMDRDDMVVIDRGRYIVEGNEVDHAVRRASAFEGDTATLNLQRGDDFFRLVLMPETEKVMFEGPGGVKGPPETLRIEGGRYHLSDRDGDDHNARNAARHLLQTVAGFMDSYVGGGD